MWSPDGKHVAFVHRTAGNASSENPAVSGKDAATLGVGLQLWIVDVATAKAHRDGKIRLNAVLGVPCKWLPDSSGLLCTVVPEDRGPALAESNIPTGPNVEENLGKVTPARTYEDMLKTPADEAIFAYYATSQLAIVRLTGAVQILPLKGLIDEASPSPDGHFALVSEVHKPFSYTLPVDMFPQRTEVLNLKSGTAKMLFDRPLVDNLPIAFDAVPVGPRDYEWRSDAPAMLVWAEAGDGGDPKNESQVHDRLMELSDPFQGQPTVLLELPMRYRRVDWGNDHLAIVTEGRWTDRHTAMIAFDPSSATATGPAKPTTLFEGSSQDRYHSPGRPVNVPNAEGYPVLKLTSDGAGIFFTSPGASPKGDHPFVATMPVTGGAETIVFQSKDPFYTEPIALLSDQKALVRQESATVPPNYFVANFSEEALKPITRFGSPYEGTALPTKQLLHYKRADGLDLTATLWLPAGYDKTKGPLPALMEAYPAEFKARASAGQVSGSENRFPRIGWGSPAFFTQTGYAVLENASIPIVGEGKDQPNDTYVEQLVAGAKAAIDYGASLGVVDPKRVAVMGHSYGAFMTANLLAHSGLFRAGIARSGAYNRTLTPYGFQAEERTYWQAPDLYYKMSPFSYADKVKTPILLIHGEADDNQGTFPIQSERFYEALKGQGATVRLVWLPLEAHGYAARESLQHMLWEMNRWLDTYVKPETPVMSASKKGEDGE
jgi:dipeptidyl aminopeptidase/acylaminoacyl peptidase